MGLDQAQIERYSRQIILPNVGRRGQEKIFKSKVLIIGAGGLGSPSALYLASAGVGSLGIVDSDEVELNNLHRQVLHSTKTIGIAKVKSAKHRLMSLNPDVKTVTYNTRVTADNISNLIKGYDIIVDASDNFPTRYLANDVCVLSKKPFSHGSVCEFGGQVMTIVPGKSACYRCLFPEPPPPGRMPNSQETGILGVVPGIIGTIQANEVLKYILGIGNLLIGRLLVFDALNSSFREVKVKRDKNCMVCSEKYHDKKKKIMPRIYTDWTRIKK
ncbi:MAG: HesA/MoeB/ThiF family protein [Candidatus Omnitrophota bacterium]